MPSLLIDTQSGKIQGTIEGDAITFRGIPYARPPVGQWRFRPPQPYIPQGAIINRPDYRGAAMQPSRAGQSGVLMIDPKLFSEDCLYLNIFTPQSPMKATQPYPVLVWFHGGSAMYGSANQPVYDGHHLAALGIIVVTVNYRLGVLGYLELGELVGDDYAGSGNNATRDQIMALQWVQQNISAFGGDSHNITIAGESSGAKSVANLLAISPARRLIRGAILSSGTGDCVFSQEEARQVADIFYQQLPEDKQRENLLTLDVPTLLAAQQATVEKYGKQFPFRAIIDHQLLTATPVAALRNIDCSHLRILMGFNRDDGWFQLSDIARSMSDSQDKHRYIGKLTHTTQSESGKLCKRISATCPEKSLLQIVSEQEYILPGITLLKAMSGQGARSWLYQFNIQQIQGEFKSYCVHASDLPYIWRNFNDPYMSEFCRPDSAEIESGWTLLHTWIRFIKTGMLDLPLFTPSSMKAMTFDLDGMHDISPQIAR